MPSAASAPPPTLAARLTDPMLLRRLRLGSGLVLFVFVALHLLMHALGNISLAAMFAGSQLHDLVWRSPPGSLALYGAIVVHAALSLYGFYARDSLRMGAAEWVRLALGYAIVPLVVMHVVGGAWAERAFGAERGYSAMLLVYFYLDPMSGVRQVAVVLVAWAHGCLGLYFWLRSRRWYRRWSPVLLSVAVLVPVLSLLGLAQGTRAVLARASADPGWLAELTARAKLGDPGVAAESAALQMQILGIYAGFVLLALGGRWLRQLAERRRGLVAVEYPGGRIVKVPRGWTVLDASRSGGIAHASVCGGRGRCTTCRVRVLRSSKPLPPPEPSERAALLRLRAGASVRLACQLRPRGDVAVLPLLPPGERDSAERRRALSGGDAERIVAILFVDIRRSTALVEQRLPYDVVFVLNHFFAAVAGSVVEAGGMPNQFLGDGMMAIFGAETRPREACRQALDAVRRLDARLAEMNRELADELPEPITIGIGLHVGSAILGELGYRDHVRLTAIGDAVHVAARLQDLSKDLGCCMVVSEAVLETAALGLVSAPAHQVQIRGRDAPIRIRAVNEVVSLAEAVI